MTQQFKAGDFVVCINDEYPFNNLVVKDRTYCIISVSKSVCGTFQKITRLKDTVTSKNVDFGFCSFIRSTRFKLATPLEIKSETGMYYNKSDTNFCIAYLQSG